MPADPEPWHPVVKLTTVRHWEQFSETTWTSDSCCLGMRHIMGCREGQLGLHRIYCRMFRGRIKGKKKKKEGFRSFGRENWGKQRHKEIKGLICI